MFDPVLRKPRYAARSQLIEQLLLKWLEEDGDPLLKSNSIPEQII